MEEAKNAKLESTGKLSESSRLFNARSHSLGGEAAAFKMVTNRDTPQNQKIEVDKKLEEEIKIAPKFKQAKVQGTNLINKFQNQNSKVNLSQQVRNKTPEFKSIQNQTNSSINYTQQSIFTESLQGAFNKKKQPLFPYRSKSQLNIISPSPIDYGTRDNRNYDDDKSEDSFQGNQEDDLQDNQQFKNLQKRGSPSNQLKYQSNILSQLTRSVTNIVDKGKYGAKTEQKINDNFQNYGKIFRNMTLNKSVKTMHPIVSVLISYDSSRVVSVTKKDDREYWIQMHELTSYNYNRVFQESVGGLPDSYIKMKDVEQNDRGNKFMAAYIDDGKFRIRFFHKDSPQKRQEKEILDNELDINEALGINNYTIPISGFTDPFITCTFINDDLIFANLFHNKELCHYHFLYKIKEKKVINIVKRQLDCSKKNFPYKCFYNEDEMTVYSFYRQGESFNVPIDPKWSDLPINSNIKNMGPMQKKAIQEINVDPNDYELEKITDKFLGQMFLINNKALVARVSNQIVFFKRKEDEITKRMSWKQYHTLDKKGFIYFIKGNVRIQVTMDEKIYFYLIDPITQMPTLENVMYNFMGCNQMMFGSKVRYCITYKTNQRSFEVHTRKFDHDFQASIVNQNLEGAKGLPINSMNCFIVGKANEIRMYNASDFQEIVENKIEVTLLESETREENEIISIQMCQNETFLGVISGKNLIMDEQKPNQLFIYRRMTQKGEVDKFKLIKKIMLKDNEEFAYISMQFHFKVSDDITKDTTSIIFAKKDQIIELNFETEELTTLCYFQEQLKKQPQFFLMNDDQSAAIIASAEDGIYYNLYNTKWVDLDQLYKITSIKEIIYDHEDQMFYLLANKYQDKLGLFMLRISEEDPKDYTFFMKIKNKLDISDADIFVLRNKEKKFKELIVSYKTIFVNTYTLFVIDIANNNCGHNIRTLFRHESFQLWESSCMGFLLDAQKDFITLSSQGISIIALGNIQKRIFMADNKQEMMIHSLDSTNYLKIGADNCIVFDFSGEKKIVSIQQQYTKCHSGEEDEQTKFDTVYKIRIYEMTLRELLLLQSLSLCATLSDILELVMEQPNSSVFYKSFMELDLSNMVSILSFDSRSMKNLLDDKNKVYFQEDFPMFYKNKIIKSNNPNRYFYRSPIENALINNQVIAVSYMMEYIVKYQNNYVSSFLFAKNIPKFILKGIDISILLESNIFRYEFDFDEWPSAHWDNTSSMRPYNGSIFDLRNQYLKIYPEYEDSNQNDDSEKDQIKKFFKVRYVINLLPMIGEYIVDDQNGKRLQNDGIDFMGLCEGSDELDIFDTASIHELIEYKWKMFARKFHIFGCIMHFAYMATISLFVYEIYIRHDLKRKQYYTNLMALGIIYPFTYDTFQLYRVGFREYFSEFWNYTDFIFGWSGVANIIMQNTQNPDSLSNKILIIIVILMATIKTFFFLRVFSSLSYIVTMLTHVIYDLRVFLIFYFMLIYLFSLIFGVLGLGNPELDSDLKEFLEELPDDWEISAGGQMPNEEYDHIGLWFGNIFYVMRMSLGDFDFETATFLSPEESKIYWAMWLIIVVTSCIIFLNFIISEISNSYEQVRVRLSSMIMKERAALITESEQMILMQFKDDEKFPRCIINRQVTT